MFHSPSSCASILKTCGRWRNCRSLKRECRLWPPQGRQCVRRNQISTKWFLRFILAHQNIQRQKPKYYQGFSSFIFAGFVPTPIWLRPQHWHATCVIHSEHTVLFPPDEFWKKHRLKAGECCIYIYILLLLYYLIIFEIRFGDSVWKQDGLRFWPCMLMTPVAFLQDQTAWAVRTRSFARSLPFAVDTFSLGPRLNPPVGFLCAWRN